MPRANEFSIWTKQKALVRQKHLCGSCGTDISHIGEVGRAVHKYGESAQAHHIRHVKFGGTNALDNCVILCWSCHYCAHEGGAYRHGTVVGEQKDFPHFFG